MSQKGTCVMFFYGRSQPRNERIEALLVGALVHAKAEYENSKQSFDFAVAQRYDLGINHPDASVGLTQVTKEYTHAASQYRCAFVALNRFILYDEIPEDLKQ